MATEANLLDMIGDTPLLHLKSLSRATRCRILAKAEFSNPGGSSKDRVALAIVREAERSGRLKPGGTLWVGTDEDVYDMVGWSNGRVRDELAAEGFRRIGQTSGHAGDVVLNVLFGTRGA